jgi:hypothetical protein
MDKRQTAVDWLVKEFNLEEYEATIKLAKAMEREQHQISFDKGYDRRNYIHDFEYGGVEYWEEEPKEFEDYYTSIYGK